MGIKVSVLTITWRPGYIDTLVESLKNQTMLKSDFEWILVDDLWEVRKDVVQQYVDGTLNLIHAPPREIKPYSATATAINTGLAIARGDLVYFMADYMYAHPACLKRHWEIFTKYGPRLLISGPIVDGINITGYSVWQGVPAKELSVRVGDELVTYKEHMPPVSWPLKQDWDKPTPENLLSIWMIPFHALWPSTLGLDWRTGWYYVSGHMTKVEDKLFKTPDKRDMWFMGRNDSAGVQILREAGGLSEADQYKHGGLETNITERIMEQGYADYLIDMDAPAFILPHPMRKREHLLEGEE